MELSGLQEAIFLQRYAMPSEKKWSDCARRVASHIAQQETNGEAATWGDRFFKAINAGDFMPGGRILFGAGRRQFNMLNCYRLHCEDTVESIGKMIRDTYLVSCGGGGIGFNFSDIRPKGDDIQNIKWSAPGSVSVIQMINEIGTHVISGKNRRTALIAILNVTHPDLFEFLHVKLDLNQLTNFNISVGITNSFVEAVKKNKPWTFSFNGRTYRTYEVTRATTPGGDVDTIRVVALNEDDAIGRAKNHFRVSQNDMFIDVREVEVYAREIWDTIIHNSWKSGDPGIYNVDLANKFTNVSYFESLDSPNPCGEIPLPQYGNCCLGHINLSNMYDSKTNDVNWKKLAKTIRVGVRFLDNVLSGNHYPIPECKTVGERSRRIGLGVTGLHYLLIKMGHRYGDESCLEFLDRLFATFRNEAYKASVEIAQEKGSFPAFDADKYLEEEFCKKLPTRIQNRIRKYGIRNAVMLTIAPCGTNSMVLGVSSGIEPIFAPIYKRHYREGNIIKEEHVADSLFAQLYQEGLDTNTVCGAYDITPEEHIAVQATIQQHIDSSISKTLNLPSDFSESNLSDIVLEYATFVKGFTIYRAGSKGNEPLEPITVRDDEHLKQLMEQAGVAVNSAEKCVDGTCEL